MIHVMYYKMQGNHVFCNELSSGTVDWAVARKAGFEVRVPKVLLNFFLSFFPFFFSGLGFGLGLWLGLGFEPKRSNRENFVEIS